MIENADQQLSELGTVPDDLQAIVARTLGDRPITPAVADELLEALAAGKKFDLPAAPASEPAASPATIPPAFADAAAVITSISAPPPALDSVAPPAAIESVAPPAAIESVAPPAAVESVAPPPATSEPPPPSRPAPMPWDSLPAPPPPKAAPMPWDSEPAPQPAAADAAAAQAIAAAFDDPEEHEAREHDTLESSPAPELHMPPAPSLELNARPVRRGDWAGSRRPDLDKLLDQPLDALDFEATEQTDVVPTELPREEEAAAADAEPSATTPPAAGDDFEILVDDEILEIAEDDVELVDDDNS